MFWLKLFFKLEKDHDISQAKQRMNYNIDNYNLDTSMKPKLLQSIISVLINIYALIN